MSTQSVLDQMTTEIVARKQAKATGLTPVGTERATLAPHDVPGVYMSNEKMQEAAADLRGFATMLTQVAEGLDRIAGLPASVQYVHETAQAKQEAKEEVERNADAAAQARFEADVAAKAQAAQDATFDSPKVATDGWVCPEHGTTDLINLTSKKGRKYPACRTCGKFAKL